MRWSLAFVLNSALLGVGLAMDAFSVSLANGLNEPGMRRPQMAKIAGVFAFFQWLMPLLGWLFVHTIASYFSLFQRAVPWIALALLGWIGGKMLWEGLRGGPAQEDARPLRNSTLLAQGVATSIDALSVGFTIAEYDAVMALAAALIIAVLTFAICVSGLLIGRRFGTRLAGKSSILGGVILIAIGLEIFIKSFL